MNQHRTQRIPSSGPVREALRQKGQFWTPDWVADVMVAYALGRGSRLLFDPAVGNGAFFRAAKRWAQQRNATIELRGTEIDPTALGQAVASGLSLADLSGVNISDFVLRPPPGEFPAIVANPPYIRHHRLSLATKAELKLFSKRMVGFELDGRAGVQVYFLLRCLERLPEGGRLACICSADICEGVFARQLWEWISCRFKLDVVITFDETAAPFPFVDINPIVFCIERGMASKDLAWVRCKSPNSAPLIRWICWPERTPPEDDGLEVLRRPLQEALVTGLSRPPLRDNKAAYRLGDFAKVLRGIATGDNEFFFLTRAQAKALAIPESWLLPAVGRTRDVHGDEFTLNDLEALERKGRPTLLLSVGNRPLATLPTPIRHYLQTGVQRGLPQKPLIATRRPWYRVESRRPPPILFAYLGRRNARFIRNRAGVVPLTCFLCVYPHETSAELEEKLWCVLRDPRTVGNLRWVGKSYGGGAIKVEPRALEALPLPKELVETCGLAEHVSSHTQALEFEFS